MNNILTVAPGGQIPTITPTGFSQIAAVRIDNFSGAWLSIEGTQLWCPPYTRGYIVKLFPTISTFSLRSYDRAYGTVVTTALGNRSTIVLFDRQEAEDTKLQDSDGVSILDEVVNSVWYANQYTLGAFPAFPSSILTPPTGGRIRIWETRIVIANIGVDTPYPIYIWLYDPTTALTFVSMTIAPGQPTDNVMLTPPAGDLDIDAGIGINGDFIGDVANPGDIHLVDFYLRYSFI